MNEPYLSVIIPTYNSADTLKPLLDSVFSSKYQDFEALVVDDLSTDNTKEVVTSYQKAAYHRVRTKKGTGGARNVGARLAKGKILLFADSDIVLNPNVLSQVERHFRKKTTQAVVCLYEKKPANPNPSVFHHFKAMRDWTYWNIERDERFPIGGFGGSVSAIRKDFFNRLGGFDESFKGAGMEDQEMGWRINKISKIVFDPKIEVKHHFEDLFTTFKNFYLRSYLWIGLFQKHKTFFGPAMNPKEAFIAGLANASTLLFFLSLFWPLFWPLFLLVFALRFYLGRKFLLFIFREKGLGFLLASLFFSHALYLAVFVGAARGYLERLAGGEG